MIKTFVLLRNEDITGISGTGAVAEGCIFTDTNEVVLHWYGEHSSTNIYHSIDDLIFLHGHEGRTKIVFND